MLKNITLVALLLLLVFGVYVFIEYPELRAYVLLMQTVIAILLCFNFSITTSCSISKELSNEKSTNH
jgi:hypothetical protein